MGTSNFHNVNAGKIFTNECEEEWDYDYLKSNICSELENSKYHFRKDYGTDSHELRSYPSHVLGTIFSETKNYKDFTVEVSLIVVVRSGYYSGCNLDYDWEYIVNGETTDELDFADIIEYQASYKRDNAKRYAKFAEQWAKSTLETMRIDLETIFEMYSDKYEVAAQFSNGETIYTKVS